MRSKWLTDCSPLSLGVVGAATDISASVSAPGTTQFPVCGFFSTFPAVRDLQATGLHRQHSVEVYTSTAYWPDDRESLNVSIKFKALNYARYKALYWTVWSSYSHCASEECYTHLSPIPQYVPSGGVECRCSQEMRGMTYDVGPRQLTLPSIFIFWPEICPLLWWSDISDMMTQLYGPTALQLSETNWH